ncbi:uncharacterized protein L969DRAFT_91907 [Mixia osmundae IAM 14324]|uniref:Metallo-beta-lactamase domain-containing protein n=1 Tax=Mixia osmundae (strain CBS 9802 / IAM 14324 / JCM 22182 / KY 12970) TaxID=764103 RepID=G7E364_MIXOS|nr:uncharacterized protein L969DRAFT_91907 [Mixia osmundae IAM 14324]KEI42466.1 hypothetical protein L969DRAFT_91907 [Mixia osmundae IAM 14324]GAA97245.1 hypothetical protein E5Q_03922 [Mixia osmundae IAM 14324]
MRSARMVDKISIQFLGTSAGKPCKTRNVSSLALRLDGDTIIFDCGEATQHQLMKTTIKPSSISKIFLTHTHGDHVFGLVPLLTSFGHSGHIVPGEPPAYIDVYGPKGIRELIRTTLRISYSTLAKRYRVHELLFAEEQPYTNSDMHSSEDEGTDVHRAPDGTWPVCHTDDFVVKAAPIAHTVPCVGYAIQERARRGKFDMAQIGPRLGANAKALKARGMSNPHTLLGVIQRTGEPITLPDGTRLDPPSDLPGRKIVILGDTYEPSEEMAQLALDADLLVHEATNAWLPQHGAKPEDTMESVRQQARDRGHSTAEIAGAWAHKVRARELALNHISSRYKGPVDGETAEPETLQIMDAISRLASDAWRSGKQAIVASDMLTIDVPLPPQPQAGAPAY